MHSRTYLKIRQLSCPKTSCVQFRRDFHHASPTRIFRPRSPVKCPSQAIGATLRGAFNYQMREVLALDKHR
jgi:hypothetical protein